MDKNKIKHKINNLQVVRGLDLSKLKNKDIYFIIDTIVNKCEGVVRNKHAKEYNDTNVWVSMKKLKLDKIKTKNKPIKKLEDFKLFCIEKIKRYEPKTEFYHVYSGGPCFFDYNIRVPLMERFLERKNYYKVSFHEIAHALVDAKGLFFKRADGKPIEYQEEVAVEIFSLVICFLFGYNVWESALSYITNWSYTNKKFLCMREKEKWRLVKNRVKKIVIYTTSDYT